MHTTVGTTGTQTYRETARLRADALRHGLIDANDARVRAFSRYLLKARRGAGQRARLPAGSCEPAPARRRWLIDVRP